MLNLLTFGQGNGLPGMSIKFKLVYAIKPDIFNGILYSQMLRSALLI